MKEIKKISFEEKLGAFKTRVPSCEKYEYIQKPRGLRSWRLAHADTAVKLGELNCRVQTDSLCPGGWMLRMR